MEEDVKKKLSTDPDGLLTYEYIANHIDAVKPDLDWLVGNMEKVDLTGQFVISAARYLFAIDPVGFAPNIDRLIKAGIEKDREHRYLGDMLQQMFGPDYADRAAELSAADDNFRRIYKRLYPTSAI
ncbi:MAG: hypothetical protein SO168_07740 [Muribaculaceae bacterium]|nr:hypothetical protein [Bacteroidales bacterium]MDY4811924.1 hypothetical protein [Muribaculaceae bacterium]